MVYELVLQPWHRLSTVICACVYVCECVSVCVQGGGSEPDSKFTVEMCSCGDYALVA